MYFSVAIDTMDFVPPFPAYYIFNCMLNILFGLHILWTVGIVRLLVTLIFVPNAVSIGTVCNINKNYFLLQVQVQKFPLS